MTQSAALLYIIASALVLGTSLYCAFRRQRSAIFVVGAYTMLLFGVVVTALRNSGVLPINLVTMNALQVGSAAEMLLLAFALADRFTVIRRDKARAQAHFPAGLAVAPGISLSARSVFRSWLTIHFSER